MENVIIKNSYFKTYLLPFPFGGRGVVENILVENNKNFCRNTQYYAVADKVNTIRKNLIYRNNERLSSHGSNSAQSAFIGVENLLIEGEKSMVEPDREQKWLFLQNCDNVVIRGCDIKNAKYIHLRDMKPEQVKLYDCEQDFIFVVERYDGEMLEVPSLEKYRANFGEDKSYRVSYGGISLEEDPAKGEDADFEWRFDYGVYERWLQSRTYVVEEIPVEEYDVKKHGEPEVPKDPDFVPYMGKVEEKPEPTPEPEEPVESKPDPVEPEPQPETPDGGGQEETPGFPEDDPKEKPETPKSEEVAKAWYKNKFIIAGAIIAIVILLIILL